MLGFDSLFFKLPVKVTHILISVNLKVGKISILTNFQRPNFQM